MEKTRNCIPETDSKLPTTSPALTTVSLLAALSMVAAADATTINDIDPLLDKSVFDRAIYSKTYATVAASSFTNGSLYSGGATTLGADADARTEERL